MKKKILLSVVALFLICFSMFGFVGCDSAKSPAKLNVEFPYLGEGSTIIVPRIEIGNNTTAEMVVELKVSIFDLLGFNANYYEDGIVNAETIPTETFASYSSFLNGGGLVTGFNLAQKEREQPYKMQVQYLGEEVEVEYKIRPLTECSSMIYEGLANRWDELLIEHLNKQGITNPDEINACKSMNPFRQN